MLSGYLPFQGRSKAEVYLKIKHAHISTIDELAEFSKVSADGRDLVRRMLEVDVKKRIDG